MIILTKAVLTSLVVCVFWTEHGAAEYDWSCTDADDEGHRYIPSITRDLESDDILHVPTNGDELHIYHPSELESCYGRAIAIEYCYQFNDTTVPAAFNWTVLILKQRRSDFEVIGTITIESCELDAISCRPDQPLCCDMLDIESFDLSQNFIFGVTESVQGNTAGATLLGFHESEYGVDVLIVNRNDVTLSLGSTIRNINRPTAKRGIHMLWFVIADDGESATVTSTRSSGIKTSRSSRSVSQETACAPTYTQDTESMVFRDQTSTQLTNEDENHSATVIYASIGGAIGGTLGLSLVSVIIIVLLVVVVRRYRLEKVPGHISKNDIKGYHNAIYDAAAVIPSNTRDFNSEYVSDTHYELAKSEELGHDYSLPGESQNFQTTNNTFKGINCAASAYEIPQSGVHDEDIYMAPASDEYSLYSQLSQIRIRTFTTDDLRLISILGAGQFGTVHKGEWMASEGGEKIEVAVKILKEGAGEGDKVKFLQEAAIMGQFSHPNVVKLYGVVTEGEPIMLIIELLLRGDLRGLLCSAHSKSDLALEIDADLPHTLLSYCRQVASGMGYLSSKLFIHRDLAARNILVSEDDVCKIADFGMSRDLADTDYYVSHGGMIPVKWTAPEAIHYKKYSTASDVWSFGCVMYEIWSLGHKPFEACTNVECIKIIDKGTRLAPPPGCPRVLYRLMIDCWHPDSSSRPDFVSVVQQLSLPDTKLLKWSEEDKATDPEAATLWAGLDKAVDLYKDLQQRYAN